MSEPTAPMTTPRQIERRRQVRGLLVLGFVVLIFSLLRAGLHTIFTPGWWRLW